MKNEIQYFKNANWAVLNGAFTPKDLHEIADRIKDENLQSIPIGSEARSVLAIEKAMKIAEDRKHGSEK